MGRHVGYDANTCSYIRALGFAFLLLSFFATIWFTVAFTMTMGLIVSGIFMYEGGISVEVFKLAVQALPTPINIVFAFLTVVTGFLLVVVVIIVLFGLLVVSGEAAKDGIKRNYADKIQSTSTYQLASA